MRKELSPIHELVACEVCGRTILKGERTEDYIVPDGTRRRVCDLCTRRAEGAGWMRESAHAAMPSTPRAEPRPSLLARLRRRFAENGPRPREPAEPAADEALESDRGASDARYAEGSVGGGPEAATGYDPGPDQAYDDPEAPGGVEPYVESAQSDEPAAVEEPSWPVEPGASAEPAHDTAAVSRERRYRRRLRDPRHVRAVPTNADAKVDRALELFNASAHRDTVAALFRTLGEPWVTALPHADSTSEVTVVVAWELSWYQYRVDLGDADEAVAVVRKGQELHEIDGGLRGWNASAAPDGALEPGGARP